MNSQPDSSSTPSKESEAIRSDIDNTRQRMDETIGAIGERLSSGRHIFDEIVGFFRSKATSEAPPALKAVSDKANSAYRGVVDTVKANPVPAVLIGAGIGWMIYETRRSHSRKQEREEWKSKYSSRYSRGPRGDDQSELSHGPSALEDVKGKLGQGVAETKENAASAAASVVGKARQKLQAVKDKAAELGSRVQEGTKNIYHQSRDRVVTTVDDHPLEVGLGCLAAGIVAGLLLPTPKKVNEIVGPTSDRLRTRAREAGQDIVQRGKRVVQAAKDAAVHEAQAQGLTPDGLVDKADKAGDDALQAADDAVRSGVANAAAASNTAPPPPSTFSKPSF